MAHSELLSPAGDPDSGYAALAYGADAVYLGMNRFSARAEATNFSPVELAEFAGYAHSLSPRRNVYLTLNTLVKQSELAAAAETLLEAVDCGIDAVIVQDLGIARLAKKRFPRLRLHASTQMAIHSLEGALAARSLGYSRVTLARELTLDEVAAIARGVGPDMEVEAFIHGTLCYSYSGLCLFSSMLTGRSGNRGRCVYSCREAADTPAGVAHPFSLKDMALGERVRDFARAGVASLKIEGRKKSPLYVAATVDYYRRLLDGNMTPEEAADTEARLRTIFARPWTRLFVDSPRNPSAADPLVVGHRGSEIGAIGKLARTPAGPGIQFAASLPVERHDGLQVDVPGQARPFGFPVDNLYTVKNGRFESCFAVPAGTVAAVALPPDAPPLSPGLPLYLASSQAVKRAYPFTRPKPGAFALRRPVAVRVELSDAAEGVRVVCVASCRLDAVENGAVEPVEARLEETLAGFPLRDKEQSARAARDAFSRMGNYPFRLEGWSLRYDSSSFIRQGEWNRLRRELLDRLQAAAAARFDEVRAELADGVRLPASSAGRADGGGAPGDFRWSVFAENADSLSGFEREDFAAADEMIVAIGNGGAAAEQAALERLAEAAGREKLRLALPLVVRSWSVGELARRVAAFRENGWSRWMVSGLAGLRALRPQNGTGGDGLDIAADWPLYAMNGEAIEMIAETGFSSCTLSPEDDRENLAGLLAAYGPKVWVVAYSDLPLFISAACAHAHIGLCRGRGQEEGGVECRSRGTGLEIAMERSGRVEIIPQGCGSVVVGETFYSLSRKLDLLAAMGAKQLRVDFRWKNHPAGNVVSIWRNILQGKLLGGSCGNFERGLV